jgi:hypothetical protein
MGSATAAVRHWATVKPAVAAPIPSSATSTTARRRPRPAHAATAKVTAAPSHSGGSAGKAK